MRRQSPYENSYVAAQMQHMSAQRMRHSSGMANFPGRPDALPGDEERSFMSSKAEEQWHWDREMAKGSNPIPSQIFTEGERGDASRSFHPDQRSDSKMSLEKQANKDPRAQPIEQDMDIGYEDNALPQTFEGLEQKFHDEIMKLTKEQHDAEDAENARHREKVGEINAKYQDKLTSLRAEHATRRDDFLRRESQVRHQQYQQAGIGPFQSAAGVSDPLAYVGPGAAAAAMAAAEAAGEARRAAVAGQYDSYRERAQYLEGARNHGFESRSESRGPYPGGRTYNTTVRYY